MQVKIETLEIGDKCFYKNNYYKLCKLGIRGPKCFLLKSETAPNLIVGSETIVEVKDDK